MSSRFSRRSVVSGAVLLPFAGIGLTSVLAKQDSDKDKDSTPASSPVASPNASPMASPAADNTEITVLAEDIKFDKTELRIPANTDVKITLKNEGMLDHDLRIDEFDFQIGDPMGSGEEETKTLNAEKGEYDYYCTVPGHRAAGMEGKLIVE